MLPPDTGGAPCPTTKVWLSETQFDRIRPLLPNKVRGVPRVDDRRVIFGIIHVIRYGLIRRHAPSEYGPHKTLYNPLRAVEARPRVQPHLRGPGGGGAGQRGQRYRRHPSEGPRTAASLLKKGGSFALYRTHPGRPQLETARGLRRRRQAPDHAADQGQVSDHRGAAMMFNALRRTRMSRLATRATTATASAKPWRDAGSPPASPDGAPQEAGRLRCRALQATQPR